MLLFPEAAMRNVSITQERSDEVSKKEGRTVGRNSKNYLLKAEEKGVKLGEHLGAERHHRNNHLWCNFAKNLMVKNECNIE